MSKQLTRKEKALADAILANPKLSGSKAAKMVYNVTTDRSAESVASAVLRKPEVMLYMANHAELAEQGIIEIAEYSRQFGKEGGHIGAAYAGVAKSAYDSILDRVHGKATQRVEATTVGVTLSIDLTGALQPDNPET